MKFILMFLLAALVGAVIYIMWLQNRLDAAYKMLAFKKSKIEPAPRLIKAISSGASTPIIPAANLLDAVVIETDRVLFVVAKGGDTEIRKSQKKLKALVSEGAVVWIDEA